MAPKKTKRKAKPKVNKGGRPSRYRKEYAEQALNYCLLGATDQDLALFFNVRESTINNWKKRHPEFVESLKKGKDLADAKVARSLYHRATGYEHPETKVFNNDGVIVTHNMIKHYPPDTTAAIFWLKNRQPDLWRDVQQQELKNVNSIKIEVVEPETQEDT